jgi:ethanolamine ammonia-lyase large subunit
LRRYRQSLAGHSYAFAGLVDLLAKASPLRSGDELAGCAADSAVERVAAQWALSEVTLEEFLDDLVVPYESDSVSRMILDNLDHDARLPVAGMSVGQLRDWLLTTCVRPDAAASLAAVSPGLTPEMVAAVSKLMRNQDLIAISRAVSVTTKFRNTLGLPGRLATRLQPNHPTDDPRGAAAAILDGLLLGCGDAVIGINPATDSLNRVRELLVLLDEIRGRYSIPTQTCVLTHVTSTLELLERGAPVDLVFQSIGGTEATNTAFGVTVAMLQEAQAAATALARGTVGSNVMYFETGQGSSLSADAHRGVNGRAVDQQTLEARAYGLARCFAPLLVNSVVGFIGPEYLYDSKQLIRASLEDHFCGKLLGLPMGVDVCYTNHAEADQDDMDTLLTLLAVGGCSYVITVPGADDVMLSYQSTSYHDALYVRQVLGLRPAPEFESWLTELGLMDASGAVLPPPERLALLGIGG